MAQNIYITGFMGAGKTRTGFLLAQKLGRKFIDTDTLIEKNTGMTITEIFEKKGERFFRDREAETIQSIAQTPRLVASLGGGAILREETRAIISRGIWVFIDTPLDVIKERVLKRSHRPLARDAATLESLYQKRRPIYTLAPIIINGGGEAEDICQAIIQRMIQNEAP